MDQPMPTIEQEKTCGQCGKLVRSFPSGATGYCREKLMYVSVTDLCRQSSSAPGLSSVTSSHSQ